MSNLELIRRSHQQHLAIVTLFDWEGRPIQRILESRLISIKRQVRKATDAAHKSAREFSPLVFDGATLSFEIDTNHPCCTDFVWDSHQKWHHEQERLSDWANDFH